MNHLIPEKRCLARHMIAITRDTRQTGQRDQ